ncbi:hypothetical protein JTB14_016439 [Gonioctena quinquepunctata]|nr:hypothetical protein JTB14_016439 [Gonioctena quinquepunctata]
MSASLRQKVLQSFKNLHKTRQAVFKGDEYALTEARKKINEEYKKCKNVSEVSSIEEMIKYSQEVEREVKSCVIQAKQVAPGKYQAEITKDTVKLDNVPYKECCSDQK